MGSDWLLWFLRRPNKQMTKQWMQSAKMSNIWTCSRRLSCYYWLLSWMWRSMEERRKSFVMTFNFDWYPDETVLVNKYEHVKELCMHVNKTEKRSCCLWCWRLTSMLTSRCHWAVWRVWKYKYVATMMKDDHLRFYVSPWPACHLFPHHYQIWGRCWAQ